MKCDDPDLAAYMQALLESESVAFSDHLGIELTAVGSGWAETSLPIRPLHLQNHDLIHGAVLAALGDHTASVAAITTVPRGSRVLSVEFKINFLRSAGATLLRCRSDVIKSGRTIVVAESKLRSDGTDELLATMSLTMAVVVRRE